MKDKKKEEYSSSSNDVKMNNKSLRNRNLRTKKDIYFLPRMAKQAFFQTKDIFQTVSSSFVRSVHNDFVGIKDNTHRGAENNFALGMENFQSGNFKNALRRFLLSAWFFPNDANTHYFIARCYYALHNTKKAYFYFRVAVALDPEILEKVLETFYELSILYPTNQELFDDWAKNIHNLSSIEQGNMKRITSYQGGKYFEKCGDIFVGLINKISTFSRFISNGIESLRVQKPVANKWINDDFLTKNVSKDNNTKSLAHMNNKSIASSIKLGCTSIFTFCKNAIMPKKKKENSLIKFTKKEISNPKNDSKDIELKKAQNKFLSLFTSRAKDISPFQEEEDSLYVKQDMSEELIKFNHNAKKMVKRESENHAIANFVEHEDTLAKFVEPEDSITPYEEEVDDLTLQNQYGKKDLLFRKDDGDFFDTIDDHMKNKSQKK